MRLYNKIMLYFWLTLAIGLTLFVTYNVFMEGFSRWGFMYVFAILSFVMYFMKRFMMKRYEKHMAYLEEQHKNAPKAE